MNDYGVLTEPRTVHLERVLPGPIELVWQYLTDSDKRGTWLAKGPMDLRAGGSVALDWKNSELSPHPDTIPEKYRQMDAEGSHLDGTITACEPPRLLAFTWGASEVRFELSPRGEDVLLVLTHRQLPDLDQTIRVASGWHAHLELLLDKLRGHVPRPFWSTFTPLEAEYTRRFSA